MGIQLFEMVLNNSEDIRKEINALVLQTLNLNGNDKFMEYVLGSIEQFDFNVSEVQFIAAIRFVIDEELKRIRGSLESGQPIDYEEIKSHLITRLKSVKCPNISLSDDFRTLSRGIAQRFPSAVTENEFYEYFMRNAEKIQAMIETANQNLVNSLVNVTPNLMDSIRNATEKQKSNLGVPPTESAPKVPEQSEKRENVRSAQVQTIINRIIAVCENKKDALNRAFYDEAFHKEKSRIARASRQTDNLIKELSIGVYDALLQSVTNDAEIDAFISERVPQLDETLQMINGAREVQQNGVMPIEPNNLNQAPLQQESTVEPIPAPQSEEKRAGYSLSKEQIVDNFIGVYAAAYINDVVEKVYPYSLDLADVSSRREEIRASFNIPAYPLSEEELTEAINKINAIVRSYILAQMGEKAYDGSMPGPTTNDERGYYLDGFPEEGPRFSH